MCFDGLGTVERFGLRGLFGLVKAERFGALSGYFLSGEKVAKRERGPATAPEPPPAELVVRLVEARECASGQQAHQPRRGGERPGYVRITGMSLWRA